MWSRSPWPSTLALLSLLPRAAAQCQEVQLVAPSAQSGDRFGAGVLLHPDCVVVARPFFDDPLAGSDCGSAEVFDRAGGWVWSQRLVPSGVASNTALVALDLEGDVLALGSQLSSLGAHEGGAAWVYRRTGSLWSEEALLTGDTPLAQTYFGFAAAVDGDVLVVGRPGNGSGATQPGGSAVVFRRNGSIWEESEVLRPAQLLAGDEFGCCIALDGDALAVAARNDDAHGPNSGVVYVFRWSGSAWVQESELASPSPSADDLFGSALALQGDLLAVGVPFEGPNDLGAAYVFTRKDGAWTLKQKLAQAGLSSNDQFGAAVAFDGDRFYASSPRYYTGGSVYGAVFAYRRDAGGWTLDSTLRPSVSSSGAGFGSAIDVLDGELAAGAGGQGPPSQAGTAFVFDALGPSAYCSAKVNSQGCTPSIASSGDTSLSGPDDLVLSATQVLAHQSGVLMWGHASAALPFAGGTLCIQSPVYRLGVIATDGASDGAGCSGVMRQPLSHQVMLALGWVPGTHVYTQFWSRDPGFAPPKNHSLTAGLGFVICH